MKKDIKKPLKLDTETLRQLSPTELQQAAGGSNNVFDSHVIRCYRN